jgi:glutathione-regulated potassium-efflux system ancillary protein KefG
MSRTLVILAHPDLSRSRINAALAEAAREVEDVTVHDLYAVYPDFAIDVAREQQLLLEHDRIVLQFPFYWYSVPPLLKKWLDDVLEHGWAYGTDGTQLHGKTLQITTSTGGSVDGYRPGGLHRFPVREFLLPLDATAHLTGMRFAEPFLVQGVRSVDDAALAEYARRYQELLSAPVELPAAA